MKKKLEKFVSGDKVIFMPENKIYDFGYIGRTGKAVIYEEGERNMQDSYAVNIKDLRRVKKMKKEEIEFLLESNKIEREYSEGALEDAKDAWNFAKKHKHCADLDYIELIHEELMIRLNPRIAGEIRNCPVYIGGEYRSQSKNDIISNLETWLKTYFLRKEEDGIKESHIFFEKIHPFEDGNGRVGRILMNIQRLNAGLPLLIIHEGEEQMEYYKWFKKDKQLPKG